MTAVFLWRSLLHVLVLVGVAHGLARVRQGATLGPPEGSGPAACEEVPSLYRVSGDRVPPDERAGQESASGVRRIYRVTAYCDRGQTASGAGSGIGQCAAPADIPFGASIYIPQLNRTFVVTDRTARRFRHNTVDLFMGSRDVCREFGCQYLECVIIPPTRLAKGL